MEDGSYVNLSLEKYNELYEKSKKFDDLVKEFGDGISDTIQTLINNINKLFEEKNLENQNKNNN